MESSKRERDSKERMVTLLKGFDKVEVKLREEYEKKIRDLEHRLY
jgi:hypothetical protein